MRRVIDEFCEGNDLPALQQGIEDVRSNEAAAAGEQDAGHIEQKSRRSNQRSR